MAAPKRVRVVSVGSFVFPEGGGVKFSIPIGPVANYDLTGKYVLFRVRKSASERALLFSLDSDGDAVTIEDAGEEGQKVVIDVAPDTVSSHDDETTFVEMVGDNRSFEFGVDFCADAESPLDYRAQGAFLFERDTGDFTS